MVLRMLMETQIWHPPIGAGWGQEMGSRKELWLLPALCAWEKAAPFALAVCPGAFQAAVPVLELRASPSKSLHRPFEGTAWNSASIFLSHNPHWF